MTLCSVEKAFVFLQLYFSLKREREQGRGLLEEFNVLQGDLEKRVLMMFYFCYMVSDYGKTG